MRTISSDLPVLAVLSGERKGWAADRLRDILTCLEFLYSAGLAVYLAAERFGIRRRLCLPCKVLSIGNLSSGGTGKTPVTELIAGTFANCRLKTVILSRGHGGNLGRESRCVSDGSGAIVLDASQSGDEAFHLAEALPNVPVFVGRDRRKSSRLAFEQGCPDIVILDDGFQYWQLARDLDLVLVDASKPFDNGHALPRGLLREPAGNIRRAGIVMVTRADAIDDIQREKLLLDLRRLGFSGPAFFSRHTAMEWLPLNSKANGVQTPGRAIGFCGIAQPDSFRRTAESAGAQICAPILAYSDHQEYGEEQVGQINEVIKQFSAGSVIMTEKDAVKIDAERFSVPAFSLRITVEIEKSEAFWSTLASHLNIPGEMILETPCA